ncbi:MAG TPA: sugar ABC transporter permease [Lachnospiraceae bacterium]|nr:sugar ABC transporter permease [Lachnospiraceae bacterium]
MNKKKKMSLIQKRAVTGLLFITPWLIGFLWFYLKGFIQAVRFSLSNMQMLETGGYQLDFTGLANFRYALFQDANYNQTLVSSVGNMLIDVPLIIFFSLFIAIILNGKFKGRTIFRAILFLPIILNSGAISASIALAQQAVSGGVAAVSSEAAAASGVNIEYLLSMLTDLGFPAALADYLIAAVGRIFDIVQASGVQIIIFIAALQSVPGALYEVSQIEGATAYETFWKVTFPMVSPLIVTNVVYTIVDAFINSEVVQEAYEMAFTNYNWGVSVAMSLMSSLVVCLVLVVIVKLISSKVFYYN